jgi:glyoxylase-like metal-dependent hydrolase (beta-lactamase superfamily II)
MKSDRKVIKPILNELVRGNRFPNLHSTVVLIEIDNRKILIDTGYVTDKAILQENLYKLGYSENDITDIVLTHFHLDHIGNVNLFNPAKVYMGKEDYDAIKSLQSSLEDNIALDDNIVKSSNIKSEKKIKALRNLYLNNAVILHWLVANQSRIKCITDDVHRLHDYVVIKRAPGHTAGHLVVWCRNELNVCIAGDALPLETNLYTNENSDKLININQEQFIKTKKQIMEHADVIYPGHDHPLILHVFHK